MATVANGQRTYVSGAGPATNLSITFADRYQYVLVTNLSTSDPLYVTSDGSDPSTSGASNTQVIMPGKSGLIANELPLWFQSSNVIQKGVNEFGGGNTETSPSSPGLVQEQRSLAGKMENPGTNITLTSDDTTTNPLFVIEAAG